MPQTIINLASSLQRASLETTAADRNSARAVSGLAEKFEGAANTSMTMPARKNVSIYLGDGQYHPEPDDAQSERPKLPELSEPFCMLVEALSHIGANPKKSLDNYPIVFLDQGALDRFLLMRKTVKQYAAYYDSRPVLEGPADPMFYRIESHMHVLCCVPTFHHSKFRFSADQRLYIRGHGMAGTDLLKEGGKTFTMSQIARLLADMGVPKDIKDIRLTTCGSADVVRVPYLKGVTRHTLDTYSLPRGVFSHTLGASGVDFICQDLLKAPAHHLADALWSEDYKDVTVVGYHGLRLVELARVPKFSIQGSSESNAQSDLGDRVRSSSVSVRFRAGTGPIPHDK